MQRVVTPMPHIAKREHDSLSSSYHIDAIANGGIMPSTHLSKALMKLKDALNQTDHTARCAARCTAHHQADRPRRTVAPSDFVAADQENTTSLSPAHERCGSADRPMGRRLRAFAAAEEKEKANR